MSLLKSAAWKKKKKKNPSIIWIDILDFPDKAEISKFVFFSIFQTHMNISRCALDLLWLINIE